MWVPRRAALLSAVVAALALPALPALPAAAATAPLPETVLNVKSIDWQAKTGNLAVTARVKCTGDGTFRWAAAVEQGDVRARNSSNVPCDDDGYFSTLILDPRNERFHPGEAQFTLEQYVENDVSGIGTATLSSIRISPR
ncbi:MAG: hypothetical protein LH645_02185 [Actinomycetia bacterium]|nr:hypothetical protein [Actinomycetes bacterium]